MNDQSTPAIRGRCIEIGDDEDGQTGEEPAHRFLLERVDELEQAIVNIHRWTGSRRCARECKRVIPDVHQRSQPTWREEMQEARDLVLDCARQYGINDAKEGTTIPPVEFCEDTKSSKMLRAAWLEGWQSADVKLSHEEGEIKP